MGGCRGRWVVGEQTDAIEMWSLRDQTAMNCFSGREERRYEKEIQER